ncbi:MAG: hypothetical protein HYX27_00020 [Acidobacteria bacterium]|nr:hypothetical protein [Acidobacteriota bacterium]
MQILPNKLYLLLWSVIVSGIAGGLVWRKRFELAKMGSASSPWIAPIVLGSALMLLVGWWNGQSVYMADESMYLLGANSYADGTWTIEAPPIGSGAGLLRPSEFGAMYLAKSEDRMYPVYPLGWPAILAGMGTIFPAAFVAPLFGIGILILTSFYARRFLPEGTAEGTIWVMVLSASFLLNCVGFTSHAAAGFMTILAAIFLEQGLKTGRVRYVAVTMLICGALLTVRPLNGALGLAAVSLVFCFRFGFWPTATMTALGAAIGSAILIWQNVKTTAVWYRSGYAQYVMQNVDVRHFGAQLASIQLRRVADSMACSFPLLVVLLLVACGHPGTRRRSVLYMAYGAVTLVAYGLMPVDSDSPFGERYLFEAMIFVFIAAGMGWARLIAWAGPRGRWALPLVAVLVSVYSLSTLTLAHHELRRVHATLLENIESLANGAEILFLERSNALPVDNYWINPVRWRQAKTIVLAAPAPDRRNEVARILGRSNWKQFRFEEEGKRFLETASSQ